MNILNRKSHYGLQMLFSVESLVTTTPSLYLYIHRSFVNEGKCKRKQKRFGLNYVYILTYSHFCPIHLAQPLSRDNNWVCRKHSWDRLLHCLFNGKQ